MVEIRPMLAASKYQKAGDLWGPKHMAIVERHLEEDGHLIVEPKWDGFRMVHHNGMPMSRSGESLANQAVQRFVLDNPQLAGIDGELLPGHKYSPEDFRHGMSQLRSADGHGDNTIVYYDSTTYPNAVYLDRLKTAEHANDGYKDKLYEGEGYRIWLRQCPYTRVETMEQLFEAESVYTQLTGEGAIVRRPFAPYKYNRATALGGELTKMKRGRPSYDAKVIGYEEGLQNLNEAQTSALGFTKRSSHQDNLVPNGRLGCLHIRWVNGPYEGKEQKVGVFRGLTHEDLRILLAEAHNGTVVGRYCEVSVDAASGGYELGRCPVWLRWRPKEEF